MLFIYIKEIKMGFVQRGDIPGRPFGESEPGHDKVEYLYNLWLKQCGSLSSEQKDEIGYAYLEHIIGADEPTIHAFMQGDKQKRSLEHLKAYRFIAMRQGNAEPRKDDYESFWKEVNKVAPNVHSEDDLKWLIGVRDILSVYTMMSLIDEILKEESDVIKKININAHAYK